MNRYLYEARFTPNELGGYDVLFPEWGIATQGGSLGDAAAMAQDLLTTYITGMLDQGKTVAPVGTFTTECPAGSILMGIMALVDPEAPEEDTMTAQEAADLLGVSRSRVYAMVRDGDTWHSEFFSTVEQGFNGRKSVSDRVLRMDMKVNE